MSAMCSLNDERGAFVDVGSGLRPNSRRVATAFASHRLPIGAPGFPMEHNPTKARPYRSTVRRAALAEVHDAIAIIREAAAWAAARGIDVWAPREIREKAFEASARKAELLIGFADTTPAATMLLQAEDPVYWPDEAPASALYLHKVAVRRSFAGQGWLACLIDFAVVEASSASISRLRLDTILRPKLRLMYEQHDFRMLEEEPLFVNGKQMIRMERILRS